MPQELFCFSYTTHKRAARRVLHSHAVCLTVVFCASYGQGKRASEAQQCLIFPGYIPHTPVGVKMGLYLVFCVLNNNYFFSP